MTQERVEGPWVGCETVTQVRKNEEGKRRLPLSMEEGSPRSMQNTPDRASILAYVQLKVYENDVNA